jgi:hypothetical protein
MQVIRLSEPAFAPLEINNSTRLLAARQPDATTQ